MSYYVDVHAHLTHDKLSADVEAIVARARKAGLRSIICNGLDPVSNREVLELAERFDIVQPSLGIYPIDAMAGHITAEEWTYDFPAPDAFDVDDEIDFIASQASKLIAIGEIGMDAYWLQTHQDEQERVFRRLIEVAQAHDLPVIIHSRKTELRCFEILQEMKVEKADFHCFGGKLKLARRIADAGYYLSIPPVVVRAESFQRYAAKLPLECLLTETDCPYMGPDRDALNEPSNVPIGVEAMAEARGIDVVTMQTAIAENYQRLFSRSA